MNLESFFEGYRQSFETGDIDAVAAAYQLPLPVVRPDRTRVVTEAETLRRALVRIYDTYRWAGLATVEIADRAEAGFEPGLRVVTVAWRLRDAAGRIITDIDVTYILRRVAGAVRIAAIAAHNEEQRRAPIVMRAEEETGDVE